MQSRIWLAFWAASARCWLMSNFSSICTWKSFSTGLPPIHSSPILYWYWGPIWPRCKTLHLALLNFIRFPWAHFLTLSKFPSFKQRVEVWGGEERNEYGWNFCFALSHPLPPRLVSFLQAFIYFQKYSKTYVTGDRAVALWVRGINTIKAYRLRQLFELKYDSFLHGHYARWCDIN